MSSNKSDYSEQAIHTNVVNYLEEDGAICNSNSKIYDINETDKGGRGARLAFKNINDRIKQYHSILEFLEGEIRADISESIPVIDFVHKENTGFLSKYYSDESGLYTKIISDIPLNAKTSDLELIRRDDPHIVNRALMGLTMSEHFYNTSGKDMADYNLQVGVPDFSRPGYVYKGLKSYNTPNKLDASNNSQTSSYYGSINVWKILQDTSVLFKSVEEDSLHEIEPLNENSEKDGYVQRISTSNQCVYKYHKKDSIYYLNAAKDDTFFKKVNSDYIPFDFIDKYGNYLIGKETGNPYYILNLKAGDCLVLIPRAPYTLDNNKLLIYKEISENGVTKYQGFVLFVIELVGLPDFYGGIEIKYDDNIPLEELELEGDENFISLLKEFVNLDKEYYSEASGLLNGYFCEPAEVEESLQGRRVTKWKYKKFDNSPESNYFIGRDYNGGSFLSKGNIKEEPLKLTPHDTYWNGENAYGDSDKIGKASLFYTNLLGQKSTYLAAYQSDKNPEFSSWANTNMSPTALLSLVTMNDIENSNKGNSNILRYAKKFEHVDNTSLLSVIKKNIDLVLNSKSEDSNTITLYERDKYVAVTETTTEKKWYSWIVGDKELGSEDMGKEALTTDMNSMFWIKFNYRVNDGDFRVDDLKMISPYEMLLPPGDQYTTPRYIPTSDSPDEIIVKWNGETDWGGFEEVWDPNPILLYPETEEYYPFSMILLSRGDLGLSDGQVISLWNNSTKNYLMLEVDHVAKSIMSDVEKVNYQGREGNSGGTINKTGDYVLKHKEKFEFNAKKEIPVYKDKWEWAENGVSGEGTLESRIIAGYKNIGEETLSFDEFDTTGVPSGGPWFSDGEGIWRKENFDPSNPKEYQFSIISVDEVNELVKGSLAAWTETEKYYASVSKGQILHYYKNGEEVTTDDEYIHYHNVYDAYDVVVDSDINNGKYYWKRYEWTNLGPSDIIDRYDLSEPYLESHTYDILDKSHDCYIYYLTPKSLSFEYLDNKFYDTDDNSIDFNSQDFLKFMIPTVNNPGTLTNPGYFSLTPKEGDNGHVRYRFKKTSTADINSLRNSALILGLPNLIGGNGTIVSMDTLWDLQRSLPDSSLKNFYGEFLTSFEKKENEDQYKDILLSLYRYLLGNLKVSEGYDGNYVYFKDIKSILTNIMAMLPIVKEVLNTGLYTLDSMGKSVFLTTDNIQNLEKRILREGTYKRKYFNLENKYDELYRDIDAEELDWGYEAVPAGEVPESHLPYYVFNDDTEKYTLLIPQPEPGTSFGERTYFIVSLASVLREIFQESLEVTLEESDIVHEWYSFERMIRLFDAYESNDMSEDCAANFDKCFGKGTYPFLKISDNGDLNPTLTHFMEKYTNNIKDIMMDILGKFAYIQNKSMVNYYTNMVKVELSKYFTDESIEDSVTQYCTINEDKLKLKLGSSDNPNKNIDPFLDSAINAFPAIVRLVFRGGDVKENFQLYDFPEGSEPSIVFRDELIKNIKKVIWEKVSSIEKTAEASLSNLTNVLSNIKKNLFSGFFSIDEKSRIIRNYLGNHQLEGDIEKEGDIYKLLAKFEVPTVNDAAELVPSPIASPIKDLMFKTDYIYSPTDVERSVFVAFKDYIHTALAGFNNEGSKISDAAGVENIVGKDSNLHPEGLYGMRYQILNGRMNRINGPLYMAAQSLVDGGFFKDCKKVSDQTIDSYSMFVNVLPIANMDGMTYLPTQKASLTTVDLKGKFYSDAEMESLRNQINSQCVLTCTKCGVKESCPFYDQNEVIKIVCTPMETIDIYLKDNELELIDEDSVELVEIPEGGSFNIEDLKLTHMEYSEVLAKKTSEVTKRYDNLDLSILNDELVRATGLSYSDYVADDMRWILGGRYGTIEYMGNLRDLIGDNFEDMKDKISPYKYCYDALFMKVRDIDNTGKPANEKVPYMTEDSYIGYRISANAYPVTYELGKPGQKKRYKVKVKLKMPAYIKMLHDAGGNDDVYLVSDDVKDPNGQSIDPVIYLGKARDLQYAFDIIEDEPGTEYSEREGTDLSDTNIYASDVAQWCMNYIKGHCTDDPVGQTEEYSNRDQYWMEKVYKKINLDGKEIWKEFPGRPRIASGYQEILIDPDDFDDVMAISGHPMVNTYYDFIRKVSIRIYDPSIENEDDRWLIPWVNKNLLPPEGLNSLGDFKEKQRATLPLMKTNLRLVVIKG